MGKLNKDETGKTQNKHNEFVSIWQKAHATENREYFF